MVLIERFIPIVVKSGNQLKFHWTSMCGYKRKIFKDIGWFFLPNDRPKKIKKVVVDVSVTRVLSKGQKKYDLENFAWGLKPVFDFLKQNEWIYEDSPLWITRKYEQVRAVDIGKKDNEFGIIVKIIYPDECYEQEGEKHDANSI